MHKFQNRHCIRYFIVGKIKADTAQFCSYNRNAALEHRFGEQMDDGGGKGNITERERYRTLVVSQITITHKNHKYLLEMYHRIEHHSRYGFLLEITHSHTIHQETEREKER